MRKLCKRIFTLLSALVLLTAVFPALAEQLVEYSEGVSVLDMRAAAGYDTDLYVCIDNEWVDVGDALSGKSKVNWLEYCTVNLTDIQAQFVPFGFDPDTYEPANRLFPYTSNGGTSPSSQILGSWGNKSLIPLGFDSCDSYAVYYTPSWPGSETSATASSLAQTNSFYTISVAGLADDDLAAVDYGDAYDTDYGRLVYTGDTATITVPKSESRQWSCAGTYESVSETETDTAVTYTFTNVAGPLTLTAEEAETINVTVQQLGLNGSVLLTQTYAIEPGSTLPAEALTGFDSQYSWYDEDGNRIDSPSTKTFSADATITTRPTAVTSGAGANFYVYLDGAWKQVGSTSTLYGPYNTNGAYRYLIGISQMEAAFAPYGFDADSYNSASDRRFVYNYQGNKAVWADTTSIEYYGDWALPLSSGLSVYDVYYLPDNTSDIYGSQVNNFAAANAFWTITLTEEATGATATFILEEETVLSQWLAERADTKLPGWREPLGSFTWTDTDSGAVLSDTDTAATVHNLTGAVPTVTITMVDKAGNVLGTVENVRVGQALADWLANNDSMTLADGTVHHYYWSLPTDTAISNQIITEDTTIIGTRKPVYTVRFHDTKPDGSEAAGGEFQNDDEAYTSITVLEGDSIPAAFITRMRNNLTVYDDYAFLEWRYPGNEGYLILDQNATVVSDMDVWAAYTQQVYVRFWKTNAMKETFPETGSESWAVGTPYTGAMPDDSTIMANAPVAGMRFRYWVDVNTGRVFTIATDDVTDNTDLYPVYERAIFRFTDADGQALTALYDGDSLMYDAPEREGWYYAGLQVETADGGTVVIPNGTQISREALEALGVVAGDSTDGVYTIPAEPVYNPRRTVVYHTGADAQFILYGAESSESYTVQVDNELILLGALDIINTTSPIGLALDGWTTVKGSTTVEFAPNASFEGETELNTLVGAGETVHLYPVWAQQTNTIAITFVSNYPDDAVDANNNLLTERSYTIYIKEGSKPTMPTLAKTGMVEPSNTCNGTQQRYLLAGWSLDQDGKLDSSDTDYTEKNGTYTEGSQYLHSIDENKTFYAVWVDRAPETTETTAAFHIRLDGTLPIEPSQYTQSGYLPGACSGTNAWYGTIKKQINVVNDVARVEANILTEPDIPTIYAALAANSSYSAKFANLTEDDYGTKWWIDWYACKFSCGYHYHVDGRVRFEDQVELNYHANGGSNVPAGTVHDKDTWTTVNKTRIPVRENFTFIGWDEDPAATVPDYPASGLSFPTSPNLSDIYMDTDKDLYAIWKPNQITIPMDQDFQGMKYEQTNSAAAAPAGTAGRYSFTIEAVSLPEGAASYAKRTVANKADGTFTFPQIQVQVPGMYVFEVREVIGDDAVQYDTAVYRLTINIVQSDYGLGIGGYSFTKNNKIITVTENNVDNVVFEFTNRTDLRNVTATKVWDDGEDQDGLRPAAVNVTLHRVGDSLFSDTQTLSAAGGWTYTWEDLPIKNSSGEIYAYMITEEPVAGYETSYSGDMNTGLIVTNSREPLLADFPVEKTWADKDNAYGYRPESIAYTIEGTTPDGIVVARYTSTVTAPWEHTFEDLPLFSKGNPVTYTLTEAAIDGYRGDVSVSVTANADGGKSFFVTNTLLLTPVTVTKQVAGNAADQDAMFDFTALVYDADGRTVTGLPEGEGYTVDADGTLRFSLAHGQSVKLERLPLDGEILLLENSGDYELEWSSGASVTDDGACYAITEGLAVTATNRLAAEIPTGVTLDVEPYLLLLGFSLAGMLGWRYRRRSA
ncbi:MAG: Cna B-type domain-containing protein [Clostridia bacterium]|nr:Cna B-type domain-containing protein [Clostridia bacterium]